jgi:hypothetical protein
VGVKLIGLGFAAMNRFPREGMPQHKGAACLRTEVGQPLPGEPTFDANDQILPIGRDNPQKRLRGGGQILVDQLRATLIQNTDVHRLGM